MTMNHFKGKQFQQDVIIVAVGYYLRYNLSYREVQEILYDRGINVSHTTIYRWVQEYGKRLYQIWKKKNKTKRKKSHKTRFPSFYMYIFRLFHYNFRCLIAKFHQIQTRLQTVKCCCSSVRRCHQHTLCVKHTDFGIFQPIHVNRTV